MSKATDPFWVITTRDADFPNVYSNESLGEGLRLLVDDGDIITGMYRWIWNEPLGDFGLVLVSEEGCDDLVYGDDPSDVG